jgi:hypothetical protein
MRKQRWKNVIRNKPVVGYPSLKTGTTAQYATAGDAIVPWDGEVAT